MPYRLLGLWVLAGSCFWGCSKSEEVPSTEAAPLEGRWLLTLTDDIKQTHEGELRDVSTVLLEIKQVDGEYQAEVLGSKPALPGAKLKEFEVDEDEIHIVLSSQNYTFDFSGNFNGTMAHGTMAQGGLYIDPAALIETQARDISEVEAYYEPANFLEYQMVMFEAADEKSQALFLFTNFEKFQQFSESHPESPLSIVLCHDLVKVMPEKVKSEKEAQDFAKAYLMLAGVWGKRMKTLARFNLGSSLAREPEFAELGLKYLEEAEAEWQAKDDSFEGELNYFRQMAKASQNRQKATKALADVKAGRAGGMETLRALSEESPFDPVLMFQRAEAARITDQLDEALKLNAQLAVWPRLQPTLQAERVWQSSDRKLPEGRLLELWVKKHGSEAGLEDYKTATYGEALDLIAKQIGPPENEATGNRVSVMELFTGTNCPPCLGADLATSALEKIYPQSQLVVLRYHIHVNGVDPLTNPRNLERFQSLAGPDNEQLGTPSVFINGKPAASSVGGFFDSAPGIGASLKAEVQPLLDEKTPLALKLSAYEHEDEISVSSKLTGVAEAQRDNLRVLLLLADRELEFPAPNGIKRHEMVVRWLFQDGASFALPSTGDFQFAAKLAVKDIRDLLESSTRDFARENQLEVKSIPLDLKGLSFVALVHDAETKEILQAAVVPVEVYDTKPMLPGLPLPKLPKTNAPTTGPMLILPGTNADSAPAKAEKPQE